MRVGYDLFLWKNYSVKQAVNINLRTHPSMIVTGYSGSGKSTFLKYYMRNLLRENFAVDLHILNYKDSDDFKFLKRTGQYACFEDCQKALENFYTLFKSIQERGVEFDGVFRVCIFDEVSAFLLSRTKKIMEQDMRYISEIAAMGRSYGVCCVLSLQRADASLFTNGGVRENMHIKTTFGNQSSDARRMLYSGYDLPDRIYGAGEGIMLADGYPIQEIKIPRIRDVHGMEKEILDRLVI